MRRDPDGYRLDQPLGIGGRAEVWSAWPDRPGAGPVAIKRLRSGASPDDRRSLMDEATVLRAVRHPHLLPVLDVVADPPGVALVAPLLAGGSLRDLLDERGTLAAGEVVAVLGPIAAALAALHRHGVGHGDLKPENVLLDAGGRPVLGDVGAARALGTSTGPATHATPAYVDPVAAAGGPVDRRADVYALAVVAYEALTGRLPHRGEPAEVVALAAGGVHRRLGTWPAVPPTVAAVVERGLDPDPARRPAGPVELLVELRDAVPGSEIRPPGPARRPPSSGRLRPGRHRTLPFGPRSPVPAAPPRRRPVAAVVAAFAAVLVAARSGARRACRAVAGSR